MDPRETSSMTSRMQKPGAWRTGDRVQIARGTLAGLAGTVTGSTRAGQAIVSLDGLTDGVLIVLGQEALTQAPGEEHLIRD